MENSNLRLDLLSLVQIIVKWKKELGIVIISTIVLSFAISFLITPLYKSTVIMFPTATNSVSKVLISQSYGSSDDIMGFGESEQTEQMLQILHSSDLRLKVIDKFDLLNHYEIDTSSSYKMTKLFRIYNKRITFRRTEFMGVEIEVLDTDAKMACDMANGIAAIYDSIKNNMQRERSLQAYRVVDQEYKHLLQQVKMKEDSLGVLRKIGVNDYESQAEVLNEKLANEVARNNQSGINALKKQIDILSQYGGAYVSLRDELEYEKKRLSELQGKYEEAKVDAEQNIPQKFIVERAFIAEKKAYPIRWLIVFTSTLSVMLLSILALAFFDKYKQYIFPK